MTVQILFCEGYFCAKMSKKQATIVCRAQQDKVGLVFPKASLDDSHNSLTQIEQCKLALFMFDLQRSPGELQ